MLNFVVFSVFYAVIGVLLIRFYSSEDSGFYSLLKSTLESKRCRLYFVLLFAFSLTTLLWIDTGALYVVLAFLCILALIDVECLALPDVLNFLFLVVCMICTFLHSSTMQEGYVERVLLGFGVGGVFFVLKILYQGITRRDIIGDADIVVLSSVGITMGVIDGFASIFLGSVVALIYALFLRIFLKTKLLSLKLPFCFFIFVGILMNISNVVSWLFGWDM